MLTELIGNNSIEKDFINSNKDKGGQMTVCVAAIAENGKKLVLAADDMITVSVGSVIQIERESKDCKKIFFLNENVYALTSGVFFVISPVMREIKKSIKQNSSPVDSASIVRKKLEEFYLQKVEEEILSRFNYNWDFFKNKQQQINQEIVSEIKNKITSFNLDVQIIIAGYSPIEKNCYLGLAWGNGILLERTADGFATSGSGGEIARYSLVLSDHSPSMEVGKVIDLVKKAVADAKRCQGVGDMGDLIVIPEIKPTSS